MTQPIKAWLSIGSTYSYLTALRINAIQRDMGLKLSVKPISIRAIMKSMDNIPFPPTKKWQVHVWFVGEKQTVKQMCLLTVTSTVPKWL